MHCFELELLTKPFHHTSTKPDFNLIVVLFPNIRAVPALRAGTSRFVIYKGKTIQRQ